jgi:hypothetical protein
VDVFLAYLLRCEIFGIEERFWGHRIIYTVEKCHVVTTHRASPPNGTTLPWCSGFSLVTQGQLSSNANISLNDETFEVSLARHQSHLRNTHLLPKPLSDLSFVQTIQKPLSQFPNNSLIRQTAGDSIQSRRITAPQILLALAFSYGFDFLV